MKEHTNDIILCIFFSPLAPKFFHTKGSLSIYFLYIPLAVRSSLKEPFDVPSSHMWT